MPELAGERNLLKRTQCVCTEAVTEVERAAAVIRNLGRGRKIDRVETTDDRIVYGDLSHEDFVWLESLFGISELL